LKRLQIPLVLIALAACLRIPPPAPLPPPEPEPPHIPPGCEADLSGAWVYAGRPGFRYRAEDDGGVLVLTLERPDGGGRARIEVSRTPAGFVGTVSAVGLLVDAGSCPVGFPTEVVGCTEGALEIHSALTAQVDARCQPPPDAGPAAVVLHLLIRPDAG
jgi:hypothetical protein